MIVSPVAGTTRDAIDTVLQTPERNFRLIDTAGIRRKGKTDEMAEKLSVIRARKSLERADVAIVLIDAVEGVTALDANIAGYALDAGCSIIIGVNKWDAVEEKTGSTFDTYVEWIRHEAPFLDFAPIVSISAKTGQRVERVLELAVDVWGERRRRIPTRPSRSTARRASATRSRSPTRARPRGA